MDQQQPPPQQPPQWSPPPPPQAGWGGTAMAPPPRPGLVTYAGIFLIVMGVLALILAVLAFIGGSMLAGMLGAEGGGGMFAGLVAVFGVIILVWAIAHLLGGYGSLTGKSWGRITGIVISVIAVVFGVLGLLGALGAPEGMDAGGLVFQILFLALYGLAAYGLIQAGPYFAYRR